MVSTPNTGETNTRLRKEMQANTRSQTSIGTGYDLSNSVFSPDGRNFQVQKHLFGYILVMLTIGWA